MRRRTPRAQLSAEERALWRRVVETARPLRPAPAEAAPDPGPPPSTPSAPMVPPPMVPHRKAAASGPAAPRAAAVAPRGAAPSLIARVARPTGQPEPALRWAPPAADRPAPVQPNTPGLDRGTARRLGRGRIAPQARLDLHGMTADRAHAALGRFLGEAAAMGLRCVLVVTGKGGGGRGGEGVLRRETPRWLGTAPFASMVVGVFESHVRHGGGGALYVYLKRRR